MPITHSAGTIKVTGYTEAAPCDMAAIYAADIGGGWGVVTKQGNLQYKIDGRLQIGDAATDGHFASENEQIEWTRTSNLWDSSSFWVYRNSTVRFGKLLDGVPMNGASVFTNGLKMWSWKIEGNSKLYLYATKITDGTSGTTYSMIRQAVTSTIIGKEVHLEHISYAFYSSNTGATTGYHLDLDKVVAQNCKYFFGAATDLASLSLKNIAAHKTTNGMYIYSDVADDVVMENYIQTTSTYLFDLRVAVVDCYMINAVVNTWSSRYGGATTSKIYRQNTFNLKVTDKDGVNIPDGATVKIYDKDGLLVVDTSTTSGTIAEQTLNYGYYDRTHVSSPVMKTPHTIKIAATGFNDYEQQFEVGAAIDWTLALTDPCDPDPDYAYALTYPMSYNSGTDTITCWGSSGVGGVDDMGYDIDHPITFTHLKEYAHAVRGSCAANYDGFFFKCKLQIGDGINTTWFIDTNKQIELAPASMFDVPLTIVVDANFRLGTLVDAVKYITKNGCSLMTGMYMSFIQAGNASSFDLFSSEIKTTTGTYAPSINCPVGTRIWNSTLSDVYPYNHDVDIRNVVQYAGNNYASNQCSVTSDNWVIYKAKDGIVGYISHGFSIKNTKLIDSTKDFFLVAISVDCYATNVECDWIVSWSGTSTGKLYRQYEFDFKIVDENGDPVVGAKVYLTDKFGAQALSDPETGESYALTDGLGIITTQTVSYGYYDHVNADQLQLFSPHNLTIKHYNHTTYIATMDIAAKVDYILTLSDDPWITKNETQAGLIGGSCG